MSTFAQQLKNEVARISRKETKAELLTLKKSSAQYRSDIAALKRRVAMLESLVKKLSKSASAAPARVSTESDDVSLRFRASGFASLRQKLGLSANEMGRLLGVSGQSVYLWEAGKAKPRAAQLQAIAKVRKMGKRDVRSQLGSD